MKVNLAMKCTNSNLTNHDFFFLIFFFQNFLHQNRVLINISFYFIRNRCKTYPSHLNETNGNQMFVIKNLLFFTADIQADQNNIKQTA